MLKEEILRRNFYLSLLFLIISVPHLRAQNLDVMTFKSFSTAKGQALFIDFQSQEVLWRFDNGIELRFPFKEVNFILFDAQRRAKVIAGKDTAMKVGFITEFSPERGLKLKSIEKKAVTFIINDIKNIELSEAADSVSNSAYK